jgi:uncharacterized protein YdeI (BOF family)
MKKQVGAIVVSILFAVGTAVAAYAAAEPSAPVQGSKAPIVKEGAKATPEGGARTVVTGELLKIDGKDYLVKDQSGKEVKFQLDDRTLMNANPKVGDKIMAKVEPQGNAYSINLAGDSPKAGTPDKQTGPPSKSDLPEPIKK